MNNQKINIVNNTDPQDIINLFIFSGAVILSLYLRIQVIDFIMFVLLIWIILKPIPSSKLITASITNLVLGSLIYLFGKPNMAGQLLILSFFFFLLCTVMSLKEYMHEKR